MRCIVCGNQKMDIIDKIPGLVKCACCGYVCADMKFSYAELKQFYSEKYFNGEEYTNYLSDADIHRRNFLRRISRLEKTAGSLKGLDVYEIGSAYGIFLDVIKGICNTAEGIDISTDAVEYAVKKYCVKVKSGDYLKEDILSKSVDMVCMWDTIEHLSEPHKYIEKINDHLKNRGYLILTTGDIGSINARVRGKKWRQIHPPTHLHYFSKNTMIHLLENYGFEVVDISYPGNVLGIRNIIYSILVLHMNKRRVFDALDKLKFIMGGTNIYKPLRLYVCYSKEAVI